MIKPVSALKSLAATIFCLTNTALLAGPALVERADADDLEYGSSPITAEGLIGMVLSAVFAYFLARILTTPFKRRFEGYAWFDFLRIGIGFALFVCFGVIFSNKKAVGVVFLIGIAYLAWVFFFRKETASNKVDSNNLSGTKNEIDPQVRKFKIVEKVVPKGSDVGQQKKPETCSIDCDNLLSNRAEKLADWQIAPLKSWPTDAEVRLKARTKLILVLKAISVQRQNLLLNKYKHRQAVATFNQESVSLVPKSETHDASQITEKQWTFFRTTERLIRAGTKRPLAKKRVQIFSNGFLIDDQIWVRLADVAVIDQGP